MPVYGAARSGNRRLITRRSQVQILPPLLGKALEIGAFSHSDLGLGAGTLSQFLYQAAAWPADVPPGFAEKEVLSNTEMRFLSARRRSRFAYGRCTCARSLAGGPICRPSTSTEVRKSCKNCGGTFHPNWACTD